jgi:hypothetical protein
MKKMEMLRFDLLLHERVVSPLREGTTGVRSRCTLSFLFSM